MSGPTEGLPVRDSIVVLLVLVGLSSCKDTTYQERTITAQSGDGSAVYLNQVNTTCHL